MDEANERVLAAELRAALTGVVPDPAAVVGDLTLSRFADDEGQLDPTKAAALRERFAGTQTSRRGPATPPGQGGDGGRIVPPGQLTRDDLAQMSPAAIVEARRAGQLVDLGIGADRVDHY